MEPVRPRRNVCASSWPARRLQTLHRVRDQLVGERTALMNQIRSILLERGHVIPQGRAKLAACLAELLDTEAGASLTPRIRTLVTEVRERWQGLDRRIAALDAEFAEQARADANARRLTTIPDIGALNATALVAAIGDVATFARGRDLAAWLGLVPRQVTTGGKLRLVGITKRGSKYLRKTPIQGARAAMPTLRQDDTRLGRWLRGLLARAHANTAVVALAAKMARIVWALLRHGRVYESAAVAA
ncbi:IS110 family RNA-guided transposase [Methylorubrum extorquens]